jgi:hypothetical protein
LLSPRGRIECQQPNRKYVFAHIPYFGRHDSRGLSDGRMRS